MNRFTPEIIGMRDAKIGRMRGAISYGPAAIEPHVPDLYNDGVHPAEALYTILGRGCQTVTRIHTEDSDIVSGLWSGGRTGVLYCTRNGKSSYGVTVFGSDKVLSETDHRDFPAFVRAILNFFHTRVSPVDPDETIEIMTFLQAADESKRQGGMPVALQTVLAEAIADPVARPPRVPPEPLARPGALVFSDDFSRTELGTDWKVGTPTFAIVDGVLKGSHTFLGRPASDGHPARPSHGAVAVVELNRKDMILQFKFRFDGATSINAVCDDLAYKDSHGGHIVRVSLTPERILLQDDKEALRNDLVEMHRDPARRSEADRINAARSSTVRQHLDQLRWYTLRIEVVDDKMRVCLDGQPIGYLESSGLAHPNKSRFHFTVTGGSAEFDDFRVWAVEAGHQSQ